MAAFQTLLSIAKATASPTLRACLSPRLACEAKAESFAVVPPLDLSSSGSECGTKRGADDEESGFDSTPPAKQPRRMDSSSSDLTPDEKDAAVNRFAGKEEKTPIALEDAAAAAMQIFDDVATLYLGKYHARNEFVARKYAEGLVKPRYQELVETINSLLCYIDGKKSTGEVPVKHQGLLGKDYEVIEFHGQTLPRHQARRCEELWQKLAFARRGSDVGLARDALCAALAVISSREEQGWMDAWEMESEWKEREEDQPRWRRRAIFNEFVKEVLAEGARGYFSNALVESESTYRIALARRPTGLVPASLLVTFSLPMCKALSHMDDGGPLRGKPADWRRWPQFALQDLLPEEPEKEGTRYERIQASNLKPEPAIRDMIRSSNNVIMLDALAALAPREEAREHGLSIIVKEELEKLFRDAKSRGQGVVFMLGGDQCESLARKVYLKPPFTNYGLRIGHLRWREIAKGPWAREKHDDDRILIGLQLP